MSRALEGVDLFAGAGGFTGAAFDVAREQGRRIDMTIINHWQIAVDTNLKNHPTARAFCERVDRVDPRLAFPKGRVDFLLAAPECTSHSYAKGGRPISEQSRATAGDVVKWINEIDVPWFVIENVPAMRKWGPTWRGRSLKGREGECYQAWLGQLRAAGFHVDERVLCAADYGDPTTRERLFVLGRRGRAPRWPEPTHAQAGTLDFGRQPWRAAREILDLHEVGESIFTRKKPLARATMQRILRGLDLVSGPGLRPWVEVFRAHISGRSIDRPLPTVTANGQHFAMVTPQLIQYLVSSAHGDNPPASGRGNGGRARDLRRPMPTVTGARDYALASAFLLPHRMVDGMQGDSLEAPLRTITTKTSDAKLVTAQLHHPGPDGVGGDGAATLDPFLIPFHGERDGQSPRVHLLDEPLPTVAGTRTKALVSAYLVDVAHSDKKDRPRGGGARPVDQPLGTVTGSRDYPALCSPLLYKYCSTGGVRSVDDPLDTLTTKDRYALITPLGINLGHGWYLDIRLRMLKVRELARGQGFADAYEFEGTQGQQVKQIGNAVPHHLATALCRAQMAGR